MPWEHAIPAFGITAAALLVGGGILLRYQRDRHHFLLMKTALEKGITSFPGATPGWLISLRVGALAVGLGIGLLIAGVVLLINTGGPVVTGGGSSSQPAVAPPPPRADASVPTPPPPPNPEQERQHRLDNEWLAARISFCAGGILIVLGIVRIIFARIERQYTTDFSLPAARHE